MASTAPTSNCSNCLFWTFKPLKQNNIADQIGMCRKNAPVAGVASQPVTIDNWPYTSSKAWCGDWQAIK